MGSSESAMDLKDQGVLDANLYSAAYQRLSTLQDDYVGLVEQAQASALAETPALY